MCMQVIEYVQYLQEKVQKHEGSYQGWSPEPTKLMPWVISSSSSLPFNVNLSGSSAPLCVSSAHVLEQFAWE